MKNNEKTNNKYIKKENYKKNGIKLDATDLVLGRLASEVAKQVWVKITNDYTPSVDTGDFIIIYNAEKIKVTGNKLIKKFIIDILVIQVD